MEALKCKHDWQTLREASPNTNTGHGGEMVPAVFQCSKCKMTLSASEAMQLSELKNLNRTLRLTFISTFIAFASLVVSVIAILVATSKN